MSRNILSERGNKDIVCDAFDCYQNATKDLTVNAGKYGIIVLNLCNQCYLKFSNMNKEVTNSNEM